ncbi:hypothetical protein GY26_13745 [Gammaproteobacteria bacterium MFB021]|nr:hypothetical protein GY26_13745 [Gammaproteobacteria bacterium MFB021]
MHLVTLAGSPGNHSRSTRMLTHVTQRARAVGAHCRAFGLADFDPAVLVEGRWDNPAVAALRAAVADADALIVATPVYQACFSGGLKLLLDLLPQNALAHTTSLALASGGSDRHLLMLDYALKPVLASLGARRQLAGVYANAVQLSRDEDGEYHLGGELHTRLNEAFDELHESVMAQHRPRHPARAAAMV